MFSTNWPMVFRMKTWMLAVVVMLSGGMASGAEVKLYAEDGTYLGKAGASPYDAESIDNPYGIYGSQYSPTSIRNPYGKYGIQSNQIGPVVRRQVTPIPRPAESAMDGFWKGYRLGYDSVERMAQRRREQQAEHERWMQDMREQDARDNELAAIREQTRELRELREALEAQRYELEAQRYQQQVINQPPLAPPTPKQKETNRNGSPFSDDFLELIGYTPPNQCQQPTTQHSLKEVENLSDEEKARVRRNLMILFGGGPEPETEEEKAARLKEEGRREWEAIKAAWKAEDAAAALKKTGQRKE